MSTFSPDPMFTVRDRYFAPCVLLPFAEDMARRLCRLSMGPLLEICADTGVLTQALAASMSASVAIIATDPDGHAVRHASEKPGMGHVTWQRADPNALPFPDGTFGIVACHFGIAALADHRKAFREVRRAMKPTGRFMFSAPAHIRHNPVAECLHDAMADRFPSDPPRYIGQNLHGYSDTEAIDDDLTAAGYTDAIYTTVEFPFVAASAREVAMGYCLGTPLRHEIEARAPDDFEQVLRTVGLALEKRFGTGPIETGMRASVVSASG
jgi:ubiquinone/menaquinone biosynthesis C-methylase UbiE